MAEASRQSKPTRGHPNNHSNCLTSCCVLRCFLRSPESPLTMSFPSKHHQPHTFGSLGSWPCSPTQTHPHVTRILPDRTSEAPSILAAAQRRAPITSPPLTPSDRPKASLASVGRIPGKSVHVPLQGLAQEQGASTHQPSTSPLQMGSQMPDGSQPSMRQRTRCRIGSISGSVPLKIVAFQAKLNKGSKGLQRLPGTTQTSSAKISGSAFIVLF